MGVLPEPVLEVKPKMLGSSVLRKYSWAAVNPGSQFPSTGKIYLSKRTPRKEDDRVNGSK